MSDIALFIDTNIYLSLQIFTDIDWVRMTEADAVRLVVPVVVTKELDERKNTDSNSTIRERAHTTIKKMESLIRQKQKKIRENVEIEFDSSLPPPDLYKEHELDSTWRDDRLIAAILHYSQRHQDADVLLLTEDLALLIRASRYDINVVSLPEESEYRLPEPLDPKQKELARTKQELDRLKLQVPRPILTFSNDSNFIELRAKPPVTKGSADCKLLMEAVREQQPKFQVGRPQPSESSHPGVQLAQQVQHMKDQFDSLIGPPPEKRKEYNRELDEFYQDYEDYLTSDDSDENIKRRVFQLVFVLANEKAPAESVYVDLHLQNIQHVRLSDELPEWTKAPEAPRRPSSSLMPFWKPPTHVSLADGLCTAGTRIRVPHVNANVSGPSMNAAGGGSASYYVHRIIHNFKEMLNPIYAVFDNYDAISNFQIRFTIRAANVPDVLAGELNVKVARPT